MPNPLRSLVASSLCIVLLSSALSGCTATDDPPWRPQGLPTIQRLSDGTEVKLVWQPILILNQGGEPTMTLASHGLPFKDGEAQWLLDPTDYSLAAIYGAREIVLNPLDGKFGYGLISAIGLQMLQEEPSEGSRSIEVGGTSIEYAEKDDTITFWLQDAREEPPEIAWGIRQEMRDGEVLVSLSARSLVSPERTPWEHQFTWAEFSGERPSGEPSRFWPVEPVAPPLAFDKMPATTEDSPYPLRDALNRAAENDSRLRALMGNPEWHVAYAQLQTVSGVPSSEGIVAERMQWRVRAVAPSEALEVLMEAPIVNGRALIDLQEATVNPIQQPYSRTDRDAVSPLDLVHELCKKRLVYTAVSIEFHDRTGAGGWNPWYGCGPNRQGSKILVVNARTGYVTSYAPAAANVSSSQKAGILPGNDPTLTGDVYDFPRLKGEAWAFPSLLAFATLP